MCLKPLSLLDVTQLTLSEVLSINLRLIRKLVVKDFLWIGSNLVWFIVQTVCWQVDPSHRHLVRLDKAVFTSRQLWLKADILPIALQYLFAWVSLQIVFQKSKYCLM